MQEPVTEPDEVLPPGEQTFEPLDGPVSPVLGHLYLRQGHLDEAETVFRAVLEGDSHESEARVGLEAVRRARIRFRKIDRLRRYLEGIQSVLRLEESEC